MQLPGRQHGDLGEEAGHAAQAHQVRSAQHGAGLHGVDCGDVQAAHHVLEVTDAGVGQPISMYRGIIFYRETVDA